MKRIIVLLALLIPAAFVSLFYFSRTQSDYEGTARNVQEATLELQTNESPVSIHLTENTIIGFSRKDAKCAAELTEGDHVKIWVNNRSENRADKITIVGRCGSTP
ncbi:hypothetical protein N6H14_29240 [Paenibacillus sp. CC-CFT747]|nr:hypothetical protein N6H14_29240 [Paenibacillus sp. CC-CFT747]